MTASLADHYLWRLTQLCRKRKHESIEVLSTLLDATIAATYRSCVDSGCEPEARIILACWACWEQEGVRE